MSPYHLQYMFVHCNIEYRPKKEVSKTREFLPRTSLYRVAHIPFFLLFAGFAARRSRLR
jgi:hypothetical protein